MDETQPRYKTQIPPAREGAETKFRHPRKTNWANQLTIGRVFLTFTFLIVIFQEKPLLESVALVLFIVASLTDYFDGLIARRTKVVTNFGILMDPLADKILTCSAFIAFVGRDLMPAWMVVIIVARELTITGLRLLAASQNVVLAAERFGKHKTTSQIIAIISVLIMISYMHWGEWAVLLFSSWINVFVVIAQWLAVILTLFSGSFYLWKNREIFINDL
ncbi:MAG: CDP-diacylglycerol--glycerol-3-phosphate 3-phosphatidyltransferase [Verrucomicrobia bacterium]|nr:CDP-diacylglycerol--glycerol-3-phosphate 3-phosphatidyltransferase [Verrucomicrobiota bacterium]MCF7707441.1 CDP-diacylglycerol--glycerol-3-phosphate 3-phosphatidyltransferase [Verrucomicrobiota bacterium]